MVQATTIVSLAEFVVTCCCLLECQRLQIQSRFRVRTRLAIVAMRFEKRFDGFEEEGGAGQGLL
jgi:hypothetical protein